MPIHTAPWIDVTILPTSWRLRVLTQMLDRLDPVSAPIRRQRVEDIRAQVATTWNMELQWRTQRVGPKAGKRPALKPIDRQIDLILGSINDLATRVLRAEDEGSAAHQAAATILARFFPQGAAAIITLPSEEELALALALDEALRGELQQEAGLIGLGYWGAKLHATLPDYEAAIDSPHQRGLTFTSLQAARNADHEAICRLVIYLLHHSMQHPADADENMGLLALYTAISERFKQQRRAHGSATPDLDPGTCRRGPRRRSTLPGTSIQRRSAPWYAARHLPTRAPAPPYAARHQRAAAPDAAVCCPTPADTARQPHNTLPVGSRQQAREPRAQLARTIQRRAEKRCDGASSRSVSASGVIALRLWTS